MKTEPYYGVDIETDTTANGLDPSVAEIVSIALWSPDVSEVIAGGTECERIERFVELLDSLPDGVAVTWNGSVFDVPFIEDRARMNGVATGFVLQADPAIIPKYDFLPGHTSGYRARLRRHRHADIAYAYRGYAMDHLEPKGWSLKPVARALGIEMVEVDRARVHELSPEEVASYNLSDARGTYLLAERLGKRLASYTDNVAVRPAETIGHVRSTPLR